MFPDYVKGSGERQPDGSEILQVDTYPLTIYSAAAVQELRAEVTSLRAENSELRERLAKLESLVGVLVESADRSSHLGGITGLH